MAPQSQASTAQALDIEDGSHALPKTLDFVEKSKHDDVGDGRTAVHGAGGDDAAIEGRARTAMTQIAAQKFQTHVPNVA